MCSFNPASTTCGHLQRSYDLAMHVAIWLQLAASYNQVGQAIIGMITYWVTQRLSRCYGAKANPRIAKPSLAGCCSSTALFVALISAAEILLATWPLVQ